MRRRPEPCLRPQPSRVGTILPNCNGGQPGPDGSNSGLTASAFWGLVRESDASLTSGPISRTGLANCSCLDFWIICHLHPGQPPPTLLDQLGATLTLLTTLKLRGLECVARLFNHLEQNSPHERPRLALVVGNRRP